MALDTRPTDLGLSPRLPVAVSASAVSTAPACSLEAPGSKLGRGLPRRRRRRLPQISSRTAALSSFPNAHLGILTGGLALFPLSLAEILLG